MYRTCLVILVLFSVLCNVSAIFKMPCPMGCVQSTCYISGGCTKCLPDWCVSFTRIGRNTVPVCVPQCPKDQVCVKHALSICTKKPKTTTARPTRPTRRPTRRPWWRRRT